MARSRVLEKKGGSAVEARGGVDAQRKVAGLGNILSGMAAPMFVVDRDLVITRIKEAAYRAEEASVEAAKVAQVADGPENGGDRSKGARPNQIAPLDDEELKEF